MIITAQGKQKMRDAVNNGIAKILYTIDGLEYEGTILKTWVTADTLGVTFRADRTEDDAYISHLALVDSEGIPFIEINSEIAITSDSYVFEFAVKLEYQ